MTVRIGSSTLPVGDVTLSLFAVEVSNAIVVFISDNPEMKLGTTAIALPPTQPTLSQSSLLLGTRDGPLARMIAEWLASRHNKLALAAVFFSKSDRWPFQSLLKLLTNLQLHDATSTAPT